MPMKWDYSSELKSCINDNDREKKIVKSMSSHLKRFIVKVVS